MVKIDIEYLGDLHCKVTHGPSGTSFLTDAPLDNNGKAEFISPTDLAAASIGSCIATIMGIKARDLEVDLKGLEISVQKEMINKPYRRIDKLYVNIVFPQRYDDKTMAILKNVPNVCPVTKSLKEEIEIIPKFEIKDS